MSLCTHNLRGDINFLLLVIIAVAFLLQFYTTYIIHVMIMAVYHSHCFIV